MSANSLFRRLMVRAFASRPSGSIRKPSRLLGRLEHLEERWVPTVGPNINITHTAGIAEAETTISMNPVNSLQLYVDDTVTDRGRYSTDGGLTWNVSNKSGFSDTLGDTQTAWDQFGNLFLTQFGANQDIEVGVSTDGGANFSKVFAIPNSDGADQPSIAVGPGGSTAPGSVWVSFTDGNANIVAAGASVTGLGQVGNFMSPETAPGSTNGDFGSVAVGPNGQVMVTYQFGLGSDEGPDQIATNLDPDGLGSAGFNSVVVAHSTNVGGLVDVPIQPGPFNQGGRTIDAEANLAWDQSGGTHNGRAYIAYLDRSSGAGNYNTDVFVVHSDDNGTSWSQPVRANDDPSSGAVGATQYLPAIALDQSSGNLAVSWLDTRNAPSGVTLRDTYASVSLDGGATFQSNLRLSAASSNPTVSAVGIFNSGDYDQMTFANGSFYRSWADNSNSTGDNPDGSLKEFDIYTAQVTITQPGITVTPTSGLVTTEAGGKATFKVVLDSKPSANVSIGLSSSKTTEGTVSPGTLTFTPANWNVAQTVTVTGVDDFVVDPDQPYTIITAAAVSTDSSYSGIDPPDVSVVNKNIEFNGFSFTPAAGLVTTEAGGQATFTVVLITKPTADVKLPLSSSNTAEGTLSASLLTFTKTNWNVPQTVTVTGVDDPVVDADTGYSIVTGAAISTDLGYSGLNPADIPVTNLNNDTAIGVTDVGSNHHYGQPVTLRATLSGLNGHPTTGLVDFQFGAIDLGTASVSSGVATLNTSALPIGTDSISATFLGDGFYQPSSGSHNVIIGKGQVFVTANNVSANYGAGPPPAIGFTATGFVAPDDVSIMTGRLTTTGTALSGVGTYLVSQGTLSAGSSYDIIYTAGTFTVTPAPLTVSAVAKTKIYGQVNPPLTFTTIGLQNNETQSIFTGQITTTAQTNSPVGTYAITKFTLSAGANYTMTFLPAELKVDPATLTVTPDALSKQYGSGALPPITYNVTGFVNDDTSALVTGSLATAATSTSNAGTYPITIGTLGAGLNYNLHLTPASVTITRAPLTVTANSLSSRDGAAIPALTYQAAGFVNGDTANVLSGVSLSTTATADSPAGVYPITVTGGAAANYAITTVNGTLTLTLSHLLVGPNHFSVGPDVGGNDAVTFYGPDGSAIFASTPFPGFTGGLRTAVGDVTGDGIPDLAIGSGPGMTATVVVIDGNDGSTLATINPFEDFTGGVYVSMGDMTGDGKAELVVTPDQGGGPRVSIFSGATLQEIHNFFGLDDPNFRGGARSALGDINGDGFADLVVSAGFGGGPRISVLDGQQLDHGVYAFLTSDFFAFDDSLRNGAFVAVGDVDGDGFADLIIGAGPGGAPRVLIISGATLDTRGSIDALNHPLISFFGGNPDSRNGVSVTAANLDNDSHSDVLIGAGSVAIAYQGKALAKGQILELYAEPAFTGPTGGVFVG